MQRSQQFAIEKDLFKKMVFLAGPRQVGKTYLSKEITKKYKFPVYLNYDHREDRDTILSESWREKTDLIVFDEIHKMPDWKNYLKGVFDTRREGLHILVTGSARLDTFQKGGDSLSGRYFLHRLLPFSLQESFGKTPAVTLDRIMERGGFPEPLLSDSPIDADRWRKEYLNGLIREDVLNFENIFGLKSMNLLVRLLRERVGSPISYTSLVEDLQISPVTVKKYIEILEAIYVVFRVYPHHKNIARSVLKEPKVYFLDTGMVLGDEGARFENLIAVSFLKEAFFQTDSTGHEHGLSYLRTKEGKEVDFCKTLDGNPTEIIEAKLCDNSPHSGLRYFHEHYGIPATQIVKEIRIEKNISGISILRAEEYLRTLKA